MTAEDRLQIAVAELLDHLGWLWWHTPNGGQRVWKRDPKGRRYSPEAKRLKAMGVKRGVSDVIIYERWTDGQRTGMGIAIELKVDRNTTTKEQDAWLAEMRRRGCLTAVCRSLDEVIAVLRWVLPLNCRRLPDKEVRRDGTKSSAEHDINSRLR